MFKRKNKILEINEPSEDMMKKVKAEVKKKSKMYSEIEEDEEEIEEEDEEDEYEEEPIPKKKVKKAKVKQRIQVVKELPSMPVRQAKDKDGTIINIITIEEALTEIMNEE